MKINLLLISIIIILTSCPLLQEEDGFHFDEEKFDTNYSLWKESNKNNYEFTQSYFSSSTGPQPDVLVNVENSQYKYHTIISNDIYDENNLKYLKTIDEVYKDVLRIVSECKVSVNDPDDPMLGAVINIEYDPVLYIPTIIDCYGTYDDDYVGGLSFKLEIKEFTIK